MVLRTCINIIALYGTLCEPFIPSTSRKIRDALGLDGPDGAIWGGDLSLKRLSAGHPLTIVAPLFSKIDSTQVEALKERFGAEASM